MSKTVLVLVVAVLVAVLTAALICYLGLCPSPAAADTKPPPTCADLIGRGPREAVVVARMDETTRKCKLKTVPSPLDTCVGDELFWEAAPVGECGGYAGTMEIKQKDDGKDLQAEPTGPGTARGVVPEWPTDCPPDKKCRLEYSVTLEHTDSAEPPLVEDPHIDIWK